MWPDKGVLLPFHNWKCLTWKRRGARGGEGATSWFHLQYLQLNKHFVSSSVLHACEFQITQRLKRTLNINWLKAEHMEARTEGSLWDRRCFTSALPPNDTGCEARIRAEISREMQSGSGGPPSGGGLVGMWADAGNDSNTGRERDACHPTRSQAERVALWGFTKGKRQLELNTLYTVKLKHV